MSFPFKGIGFDWAYTLMDLGDEDDDSALQVTALVMTTTAIGLCL